MRLSYIKRLFIYFSAIFALFTVGVVVFEHYNVKRLKTEALEKELNSYAQIVEKSLAQDPALTSIDSLTNRLFPEDLRLTVISTTGKVLYDNEAGDTIKSENHLHRPEIQQALKQGKGKDIRLSATLDTKFFYFARKYENTYIRVALPYNIHVRRFLEPKNAFLYLTAGLFVSVFLLLFFLTHRFNKSIKKLRDFVLNVGDKRNYTVSFPNDELGDISRKITENYKLLNEKKREVDLERSKLLDHVKSSKEGICFFSKERETVFYNDLFSEYLNTLTDDTIANPSVVFTEDTFQSFQEYMESQKEKFFETQIEKQGKTFSVRVNLFDDESFELILNDISHQEKTRVLKQEMTGNIAHELRTPVSNIRGYLETIQNQNLSEEQQNHFIHQAFKQSILLSELIKDMRMISKIEEGSQTFKFKQVNIGNQLQRIKDDLEKELTAKQIQLVWDFSEKIIIQGNRNLIYSIFRNLVDNAVRYAGEKISIQIQVYREDDNFYYFTFYDNGKGISDEKHLPRIFERFYRVNEGRTRDTGGTGLGLSIVKNAILFHKGKITAKNRTEGGLEFLFTLHK